MPTPSVYALLSSLALLAASLSAQVPERTLRPGDTVEGRLEDDRDTDVFGFEAFAGTTFDARLKTDGFEGVLELFDLTQERRIDPGMGDRLRRVTLPSTGLYALRVAGVGSGFGSYSLKTKAREPREVRGARVELLAAAGRTVELEFAGRPGALVSGQIQTGRDSAAEPSPMVVIERPDGGAALLPQTSVRAGKVRFQDVMLEAFGTHRLIVTNQGPAGTLRIQLKVKAPRLKKKRGDELSGLEVEAPASPTDALVVRLTGRTARAGAGLLVLGGETRVEGRSDARCAFAVDVPLGRNRRNLLHVLETSAFGFTGPAASVVVVQDGEAPFLRIDHPAPGTVVDQPTVTVAGRVGDRLSGLAGLGVFVNGVRADVQVGPDGVGTFEARDVPLPLGTTTVLDASARDRFANTGIDLRPVDRVAPSGPRLEIVSGDGQRAVVGALLPLPIVVRARNADGTPRVNQLVTVELVGGDGRLGDSLAAVDRPLLQLTTDSAGAVSFFWRLGQVAGLSNQRVRVSAGGFAVAPTVLATAEVGAALVFVVDGEHVLEAERGARATEPFRVRVLDGRNGVPGIAVGFRVAAGDATLGEERARLLQVFTDDQGRAAVSVRAGADTGSSRLAATYSGNVHGPLEIEFRAHARGQAATALAGVVRDAAGRALEDATCVLHGAEPVPRTTTTDAAGRFAFPALEASGPARLVVDGGTVTAADGVPVAAGSYGSTERALALVAHVAQSVPEVLLHRIDPRNRVANWDGGAALTLTIDGVPGVSLFVAAGSMRDSAGDPISPTNAANVSLDLANADDAGAPLPNDWAPRFAWHVEPHGAALDPPARLQLPNVVAAPAGARLAILGIEGSSGGFAVVGTATVSADGRSVTSDPGSGVRWGGFGALAFRPAELADVRHDGAAALEERFAADLMLRVAGPSSALARHDLCVVQEARAASTSFDVLLATLRDHVDRIARRGRSVDGVAATLGAWTPQADLSTNDLVSVLAGLGHHGPFDLLPHRVLRHAAWSDAEDVAAQALAAQCLAANPDVSPWLRPLAAALVAVDATHQRELVQALGPWIALPGDPPPPAALPALTPLASPSAIVPGFTPSGPLSVDVGVPFLDVSETRQLTVLRREPNGTLVDVTAASNGTLYFPLTGNGAISVSADGLVTVNTTPSPLAALHARFFVVVRHGADVAIAQLAIRAADADGDLLADAYETQVGLDPGVANAGDADADLDGLTDLVECLLGTDPLEADTDGDGTNDFDEVAQGSDPRDPNDQRARVRAGDLVRVGPAWTCADALGGFHVRGVPAGRVHRVRVVGLTAGGRVEGFSDFFATPAGTTIDPGPIDFAPPAFGRPAALQLTISDPVFPSLLATRPTQALATSGSGALADVSGAAAGTSYASSDPAVVTVDPDGVLQAVGDGVAHILATRDGWSALLRVEVAATPATTNVIGRAVLPDGSPLAGATVWTHRTTPATTGMDGAFAVTGVPADGGPLNLAILGRSGAAFATGSVSNVAPRVRAITDVGEVVCSSPPIPNLVTVFDPVARTIATYATNATLRASATPIGLAVTTSAMDVDGALWVGAGEELAKVRHGFPTRILLRRAFPGSLFTALAVAPDRTVFAADAGLGRVWHLNAAGHPLGFLATAHADARGVAVARDASAPLGYVVWATSHASGVGSTVVKLEPSTWQAPVTLSYAGELVRGIAVDETGNAWVPVDAPGAVAADRLDGYDPAGTPLPGTGQAASVVGTALRHVVVAPTGGVFASAGADAQSGAGEARLFGFEPPTAAPSSWDLNGMSPGAEPRGVWLDGEGHVWTSLSGAGALFMLDRVQPATTRVPAGTAPTNVGDPCGYLLAFLIFPDEDFDGDGTANRLELQQGTNPFVR